MTIQEIIIKASIRQLSEQERHDLISLLSSDDSGKTIDQLSAAILNTENAQSMDQELAASMLDIILADERKPKYEKETHRVQFLHTAWFRVAAAVLIILMGAFVYTTLFHTSETGKEMVIKPSPQPEILPGGNKAMLTLADGSTIILDSATNGKLAEQSGSNVIKQDGEIIYDVNQFRNNEVVFNTMSTPKGGQYQLTLSDGTKVWLNAASSITYPTVFAGRTREVNVTGEIYFEVARNKSKPFIVKTILNEITVLGTSFNINTYSDEKFKTSLVEGSVKVGLASSETLSPAGGSTRPKAGGGWTLKPGEAFSNGKIINTNIEQDIAWKNGLFNFQDLDVKEAMRQLARWYDVEVIFNGDIPPVLFKGKIRRTLTLQEVLEGLEGMGNLHFKLKGRQLYINL